MRQTALQKPTEKISHSRLDFHMGEALCRVASMYPTLLDIILEQVQNAIDANAKNILVVLNRKTSHIAIRDDGDGVTQQMFNDALQRVCLSGKEAGKLGRFGIGLISPLGKCERFTFTSCHRTEVDGYREWSFVTDDIRAQQRAVAVPHQSREDLYFIRRSGQAAPRGRTTVMWRTEVNIFNYSPDKMISRIGSIESLRDTILDRFSAAMRKKGITLQLKFKNTNGSEQELKGIQAKEFTGRPLSVVHINDSDAGDVTFSLFIAQKTTKGQNGKVNVGETNDDFRFSFAQFARSLDGLLSDEIISGLNSGVFEGEITADNVQLHSTRRQFEKDDALVGFCVAIEKWFQKHGVKHLTEVSEERRDQRYQDLGIESLREIEAMLEMPEFGELRSILGAFKVGSADPGTEVDDKRVLGTQAESALLTSNNPEPANDSAETGGTKSRRTPEADPYTVAGPRGRHRALVKRENLGLQFSYVAMDGSDRLWELDSRQGVLHFNVNHPIWVTCDVSDRKVRQLQETVTINALIIEAMPDEYREALRMAFDETLKPLTYLYHVSPAFNIRKKTLKN